MNFATCCHSLWVIFVSAKLIFERAFVEINSHAACNLLFGVAVFPSLWYGSNPPPLFIKIDEYLPLNTCCISPVGLSSLSSFCMLSCLIFSFMSWGDFCWPFDGGGPGWDASPILTPLSGLSRPLGGAFSSILGFGAGVQRGDCGVLGLIFLGLCFFPVRVCVFLGSRGGLV